MPKTAKATPLYMRALHALPPEPAHRLTLAALQGGVFLRPNLPIFPELAQNLWGLHFSNPLGLAAGFDKNAEVPLAILRLGFGFTECGSVTPLAQEGNAKPRVFRLPEQRALINRLGFNNDGLAVFVRNLAQARQQKPDKIIGVNLGKNKDQTDAAADYIAGLRATAELASYWVINISSPNTPGLRGLQNKHELQDLLEQLQSVRSGIIKPPPLLVKLAPDLDEAALDDISEVVMAAEISGLILTNTTISRPADLPLPLAHEAGGLSGRPLQAASLQVLKQIYQRVGSKIPLMGVGGIDDADSAYQRVRAGASLLQLYTALVYRGPMLVKEIIEGLALRLKADGFTSLQQAIGIDASTMNAP